VTEDYWTLLPKSLNATTIQKICETDEDTPVAPVEKGAEMGTLKLLLNGELLTDMTLVTESAVELDMTEFYKEKVSGIFDTWQFKTIVVLVGVLIVLCIITSYIRKTHKKRVSEMNRRRKITMLPQNKGRGKSKKRNIRR
ncbi:MAG: hypothetical protein IJD85_07245, partial [Oscillospiraceae bacterium]|nr:hypothetical protein [Oscillospiraceae bacterium]